MKILKTISLRILRPYYSQEVEAEIKIEKDTREGGRKLKSIIKGRNINMVCGYNYVVDYVDWKTKFDNLCI